MGACAAAKMDRALYTENSIVFCEPFLDSLCFLLFLTMPSHVLLFIVILPNLSNRSIFIVLRRHLITQFNLPIIGEYEAFGAC